MAWNGSLQVDSLNTRHVSMQIFRHSLSDDSSNINQGKYPVITDPDTGAVTYKPHILFPQSQSITNANYNPNLDNVPADTDKIRNPFYVHPAGEVSFAPCNLPDLEDMSWNLNKLKLRASQVGFGVQASFVGEDTDVSVQGQALGGAPAGSGNYPETINSEGTIVPQGSVYLVNTLPDVPKYQVNEHRRQSYATSHS